MLDLSENDISGGPPVELLGSSMEELHAGAACLAANASTLAHLTALTKLRLSLGGPAVEEVATSHLLDLLQTLLQLPLLKSVTSQLGFGLQEKFAEWRLMGSKDTAQPTWLRAFVAEPECFVLDVWKVWCPWK